MGNPFAQTMVKLQIPEGMGTTIAAGGFLLQADADGCVEVPGHIAAELRAHGLKDPAPKPAKK